MQLDLIHQIFENNQTWISEKTKTNKDFFKELARGQSPELLYIGCSDSRVPAEDMMGLEPGQVFIHRNVANLVVGIDNNINAVIQFAIEYLKVKHIIVCGHYECGGIRAALHPKDMGQLNNWLQTLRNVYRYHKAELESILDDQEKFDRLVELNVIEQCINVIKIDHVQRAWYKTGYPIVHGWVFNIRNGKLIDLEVDMDKIFSEMRQIYDIHPFL
jgi:carbonic anhydrase